MYQISSKIVKSRKWKQKYPDNNDPLPEENSFIQNRF